MIRLAMLGFLGSLSTAPLQEGAKPDETANLFAEIVKEDAGAREEAARRLARRSDILPLAARVLTGGRGAGAMGAALVLEAWYRFREAGPLAYPDQQSVLPLEAWRLDEVPDLLGLIDRLRVQGRLPLPIRIGSALTRTGTFLRKPFSGNSGPQTLSELLPPPGPGEPGGIAVRIRADGVYLLPPGGDALPPRFFLLQLSGFLDRSLPSLLGSRCAIELGSLGIAGLQPWLEARARLPGEDGRRGRLALAAALLSGLAFRPPEALLRAWLEDLSRSREDSERLYLGQASRLALSPRPGGGPPEIPSDYLDRPAGARILAGIPPRSRVREIREVLGKGKGPLWWRYALLRSLACLPADPFPQDLLGDLLLGAWEDRDLPLLEGTLRLAGRLLRPGPSWPPLPDRIEAAVGDSFRRGTIFAAGLGRLGPRGRKACLEVLMKDRRKGRIPKGVLGLLEVAAKGLDPDSSFTFEAWKVLRTAGPGTELLADLMLGPMAPLEGLTAEDRALLEERFRKLLAPSPEDLARIGDTELFARLRGSSLGTLCLALPRGPGGKDPALWIADWLSKPSTETLGLAAAEVCLPRRTTMFQDILAALRKGRGFPPSRAMTLLGNLVRIRSRRPDEAGVWPWPPGDPLFRP